MSSVYENDSINSAEPNQVNRNSDQPTMPENNSLLQRMLDSILFVYEKTHGTRRVTPPRFIVLKLIWLLCLLVSMCFCVLLVVERIFQYNKFEVTSRIRDIYYDNMTFPVVTVCNFNPMGTPIANQLIRKHYLDNYNVNISSGEHFLALLANKTIENDNEFIFYSTFAPNFTSALKENLSHLAIYGCQIKEMRCDLVRDFER